MTLWVLPKSMTITTMHPCILPISLIILRSFDLERAWIEMLGSDSIKPSSICELLAPFLLLPLIALGSSSSLDSSHSIIKSLAILHLCSRLWMGDRCYIGTMALFSCEGGSIGNLGGGSLPLTTLLKAKTFSSYTFTNPKSIFQVGGLNICTMNLMSYLSPLRKQLSLYGSANLVNWLEKTSNSVLYASTVVVCYNFVRAFIGSL